MREEHGNRGVVFLAETTDPAGVVTPAGWDRLRRTRLAIRGAVQGVGFRPFVYRLATGLGLKGWVSNSTGGVFIEVEGDAGSVEAFNQRLRVEAPPLARIQSIETWERDPCHCRLFEILESDDGGPATTLVFPDIATCGECLADILDPGNRRYLYPFTTCTNCGPRYSIIEYLPYDRPNTSMKHFEMCVDCRREYGDPSDRRFHAQPIACPRCGPKLALWDNDGAVLALRSEALQEAARALRDGAVLALKGLGGFQLLVDAENDLAVRSLRKRKKREEKPFAILAPSIDWVRCSCGVLPVEERLLLSPESPIVLLEKRTGHPAPVAESVAPGNPHLGVMLPYTPLHHLLARLLGIPVVATSGNLSEEPICIDERDALRRLGGIADLLLVHDRPIVRHVDDSIVRMMCGREMMVRRARGFAPLPVPLVPEAGKTLAVGAHLKNSVAISVGGNAVVSQHVGDLETRESRDAFSRTIESLEALFSVSPEQVVADMHPDYHSTSYAVALKIPIVRVQHHLAHVAACMADNGLDTPVLGVSWDGTGFGPDGNVWGGEFFRVTRESTARIATFRPFSLPGGEIAIREPRRSALGLLYAACGDSLFEGEDIGLLGQFTVQELEVLRGMLRGGFSSPLTTSVGRLFDAIAALLGVCQRSRFEGQAAMEVEFCVEPGAGSYHFELNNTNEAPSLLVIDWAPMLREILDDLRAGVRKGMIAGRFHNMLAEAIIASAKRAGEERVVLSGGCFQNRYLLERSVERLREEGFTPYWHQRIPPNDGGIAVGQLYAAAMHITLNEASAAGNGAGS